MAMLKYSNLMIMFPTEASHSGEAALSVDLGYMCGTVDMMGANYVVRFWSDKSGFPDEEYVQEQIRNCKKLLDKYDIQYKLVKFKK